MLLRWVKVPWVERGSSQPQRGDGTGKTPSRNLYPKESAGIGLQREEGPQILGPQGCNTSQGAQSTRRSVCYTNSQPRAHCRSQQPMHSHPRHTQPLTDCLGCQGV